MNQDSRVNYIELPAKYFRATKKFYSGVFGWTFEDFGDDYCAFNDGRLDGGFYRSTLKSESTNYGAALVVIYADNLEAMLERIISHGGEISTPIFSFPGGRRFHFHDPNGNELAVWSEK